MSVTQGGLQQAGRTARAAVCELQAGEPLHGAIPSNASLLEPGYHRHRASLPPPPPHPPSTWPRSTKRGEHSRTPVNVWDPPKICRFSSMGLHTSSCQH